MVYGYSVFKDVVSSMKSQGLGLIASLFAYSSRAISKFSFIAQFFDPPSWMVEVEARALSEICKGPYKAIPKEPLRDMRESRRISKKMLGNP